uniref:Uncharacterized protein n=1 Tax=Peronospora matthiolae TaxID=2874970 RepID=A0AAV1UEG6_9STRA
MQGVEIDARYIEMESMQPEQDAIPSLLMPQGQSAPTGFELESYREPPTSFAKEHVVFDTPANRSRRSRESVFLLEDGTDAEEERNQKEVMYCTLQSVPG